MHAAAEDVVDLARVVDVRTAGEQAIAGVLDVVDVAARLAVEPDVADHPVDGGVGTRGERRVPDDRLGEEVGVAIVLAQSIDSLSADELRGFLAKRIAKFKIPRYVWFSQTALPRNASGKFLKRELRESLDVADAF